MENTSLTSFVSAIYWRKNYFYATPVVVILSEGTITVLDKKLQTVVATPLSDVQVGFSMFGTMTIETEGKKYDFTGSGGGGASSFSREQSELLSAEIQKRAAITQAAAVAGSAGIGLGAVSGAAGATVAGGATSIAGFYSGLASIKQWQAIFTAAGVTQKGATRNVVRTSAIIIGSIILVVGVLTAVLTIATQ